MPESVNGKVFDCAPSSMSVDGLVETRSREISPRRLLLAPGAVPPGGDLASSEGEVTCFTFGKSCAFRSSLRTVVHGRVDPLRTGGSMLQGPVPCPYGLQCGHSPGSARVLGVMTGRISLCSQAGQPSISARGRGTSVPH